MIASRLGFDDRLAKRLLELRREIHRHPELAFEEHETARRLEAALSEFCSAERVATTGVVARIPGSGIGPTVALRGDIDALPVQERTDLDFASEIPNVMHACGHDIHATWTIGAAALLAGSPAVGDVVILLQPGEETGRGASRLIDAGVLDGVRMIFGAHVDRRFPVGAVVADEGALAASADTFRITLRGEGAHGARPHEAADPIVAAAETITTLQRIVSRRLDPASPAVASVGTIRAGNAPNVIPDVASLSGTVRATTSTDRNAIHSELQRVVDGIERLHGVTAELDIELGPPPVVNPVGATQIARTAVTNILGAPALVPLGFTNMAGEDFASYQELIPGCFLRVGAREENSSVIPAHSPQFYGADDSIFVGAAVLAECARIASAKLANGG